MKNLARVLSQRVLVSGWERPREMAISLTVSERPL